MKPALKIPLFTLITLAVVGGGITAYFKGTTPTLEERYRLQTVEKGDLVQTVSANGTLNPVVLVNVGTQVSGTVTKLYVDFNDKVEKGQPLLELDRSLLAAQARHVGKFLVGLEGAVGCVAVALPGVVDVDVGPAVVGEAG